MGMRYLVVWKTRTFCRFPSMKLVEPSLFGVLSCRSKKHAILIMKFDCRGKMCSTSFRRFAWICSLRLEQKRSTKIFPKWQFGGKISGGKSTKIQQFQLRKALPTTSICRPPASLWKLLASGRSVTCMVRSELGPEITCCETKVEQRIYPVIR